MTQAADALTALDSDRASYPQPKVSKHGFNWAGLGTVFWLTLRQQARARKLLILAFVFALPSIIILLIRVYSPNDLRLDALEFGIIFNVIPHVMITLTALLYASAMIQDEIEEQTLTYLLIRPVPRWGIYLTKLAATLLLVVLLAGIFTIVAEAVTFSGAPEFATKLAPLRLTRILLVEALALLAYCSLFGCMGVLVRYALFVGLLYSIVFEGFLANWDFAVRRMTIMYYVRVLSERWLELDWHKIIGGVNNPWSIDLNAAPSAASCVRTLVVASAVLTVIAILAFTHREFRVKTPEGR